MELPIRRTSCSCLNRGPVMELSGRRASYGVACMEGQLWSCLYGGPVLIEEL
jgi:hypothetical protein